MLNLRECWLARMMMTIRLQATNCVCRQEYPQRAATIGSPTWIEITQQNGERNAEKCYDSGLYKFYNTYMLLP
jgi:hypothetical protein